MKAQVEFRGAGFHYPGAEQSVLHDISFVTERGETTAIVGSSGAGKTTLINLVARLFDVTSGQVLVDGVDVRDLETHALTDRIGLVPQKPFLFSGTVASNLRYGKPDATEDEMWEALRVAQAEDFVARHARRPRGPHRAGRHQRVGWAAPATVDRAGADPSPRDLRVRRLVLRARPHHRRPPARRAARLHRRRRRVDRGAARVDDLDRRSDHRARRRRDSSARARTTSCWRTARPTPRSCSRRSARRRWRRDHQRQRRRSGSGRDRRRRNPARLGAQQPSVRRAHGARSACPSSGRATSRRASSASVAWSASAGRRSSRCCCSRSSPRR